MTKILIVSSFIILAILLVVGFFVLRSSNNNSILIPTPQPKADRPLDDTPTPTLEVVDPSLYPIKILNGTRIVGEAQKARTLLLDAGYVVNLTGNAQFRDFTETEISAKKEVKVAFIEKLREVLSKNYKVNSDLGELEDSEAADVVITIGSTIE